MHLVPYLKMRRGKSMKISCSFYSLQDLSDISNGEKLLEILLSGGLIIDKAGNHEPIRKDFSMNKLREIWKRSEIDGEYSECCFLFKGKEEIKFSGMATWSVNVHPNSKSFNGIDLWINTPKNYNTNKLIELGDKLFAWSGAEYGYITEDSKGPSDETPKNIYNGIFGLVWINYFGPAYTKEPTFNIPDRHTLVGDGIRVDLAETPNDESLSDTVFLESNKEKIGAEWFSCKSGKYRVKIPILDRSAITKC